MLKKFIAIKNVGTFRNSPAHGIAEFRRFSLVHAENGRGKTTLCAILRSLQGGEPNHILERKTLDSPDAPAIDVLLDAGTTAFKSGRWSQICPQIEIFDAAFVAENVYSGDLVTHDHKKNLCRVILGAEGVQLANKFDECDGQVKTRAAELTTAKSALEKIVPKAMTLDQFLSLSADPAIDQKVAAKKAELAVVADGDAIKRQLALATVELPQPPSNLTTTLQKTIEGVSSDAERLIREHIEAHAMNTRGETWLAEGLRFDNNSDCPFCAQPLAGSSMVSIFHTYFSAAYSSFRKDLDTFKGTVEKSLSDATLLDIQRSLADNATLVAFWKKHVQEEIPTLSFDDRIQPTIRALRCAIEPLVNKKLHSPLERVEYSEAATEAIKDWKTLHGEVQAFNEQVTAFNASVARVKAAAVAQSAATLQRELATLEAQKTRHEAAAIAGVQAYVEAKNKKVESEGEKENAKSKLDAYNTTVIDKYRGKVNELLGRFGAAFNLAAVKIEYTGRTPRTAYSFEIRGKEVDPGGDNTPAGTACFRNTLSAGDRNTLALAFFVAQVRSRTDLADVIVIFDDPFTSLDSFRQNWTCNTLRKLSNEAKQVVVLSHSLDFLRLLAQRCDKASLSTHQIDRHNRIDSQFVGLNLEDATLAEVDKDIIQLRNFHLGDDKDASKTIRCIRPVLENHIRKMAPDHCPSGGGWLGTFLGEIAKAAAVSPLAVFKPMYEDLDYLNGYTSPYAHDSGISPTINEPELTAATKSTLALIGRL